MKSILLLTHSYPYGKEEETFLFAEMEIASKRKIDLTIIPLKSDKYRRDLPLNIKLNSNLAEYSIAKKIVVFLEMMFSNLFWKIPFQGKNSPQSIKHYYYAIKYLYGSFLIKHFIVFNKNFIPDNAILYSYWFNHTSLGAVLAKLENPVSLNYKIITRGHGFDVYEDNVGIYFPFRELNLRYIDHVYTVSNKGKLFLSNKYPGFNDKISISRLGTLPIEQQKTEVRSDTLSFLSCSSIIPIKRVDLIFSSILNYASENPNKLMKWTHIGSGSGYNYLQNLVKSTSVSNFSVELKGFIDNKIVREFLAKEKADIFINLSISEGIPVSIMEAISVDIPILATDVGGNNEIVTSETGFLVSVDFTQNAFNLAVNNIIAMGKSLRASAYLYYITNFNAETNYSTFYDSLFNSDETPG